MNTLLLLLFGVSLAAAGQLTAELDCYMSSVGLYGNGKGFPLFLDQRRLLLPATRDGVFGAYLFTDSGANFTPAPKAFIEKLKLARDSRKLAVEARQLAIERLKLASDPAAAKTVKLLIELQRIEAKMLALVDPDSAEGLKLQQNLLATREKILKINKGRLGQADKAIQLIERANKMSDASQKLYGELAEGQEALLTIGGEPKANTGVVFTIDGNGNPAIHRAGTDDATGKTKLALESVYDKQSQAAIHGELTQSLNGLAEGVTQARGRGQKISDETVNKEALDCMIVKDKAVRKATQDFLFSPEGDHNGSSDSSADKTKKPAK